MSEDHTLTAARTVAAEVVAVMAEMGITQEVLAKRVGWNQQRLSRRLAVDGKSFVAFTAGELVVIATALGLPPTRFLPDHTPAGAA